MVTLRWKLGPRGSECAWVTKPEQSAPQGRVTTARSPPILLRPHSLEMGRLAKGHRKMPQSQDWIMVSAYVQMFSPLKKKKKKKTLFPGWSQPSAMSPVSYAGQPWDRESLCAFRPQTLRSALTHTPLQRAAHGGPGHRKTGWDRQVSPGTATLHLSLSPLTHREQCWQGASDSPTWRLF